MSVIIVLLLHQPTTEMGIKYTVPHLLDFYYFADYSTLWYDGNICIDQMLKSIILMYLPTHTIQWLEVSIIDLMVHLKRFSYI